MLTALHHRPDLWRALQRPRRRQLGQDCQLPIGQRPDRFSNPTDVALVHLVARLFDGRDHPVQRVHRRQPLGPPFGRRNVPSESINKRIEPADSPNDRLDQTSQQAKIGTVGSIGKFLDRTTKRLVAFPRATPIISSVRASVAVRVPLVQVLSTIAKVADGKLSFAGSAELHRRFCCCCIHAGRGKSNHFSTPLITALGTKD